MQNWLPALDGVVSKLERGAKVADIGCGTGQSTFIMARAFPSSTFVGYDFHPPSIEHATAYARTNGAENIRFEVARAKDFPARDLDLVTCFDVLHDLGDPVGAATHIHRSLKPDGTWMLMEPLAGDAPKVFRSGRDFAAWIGIVPRQELTGGKQKLGPISKRGDQYLRRILVVGAHAVLKRARHQPEKYPWVTRLLERKPFRVVAVAVANKTARVAWALLARGGSYRAPALAAAA